MAEDFEYISRARLEYREGYRNAYLGEVPEPVVYGVQGALRQYYVEGRISGIGKTIRIKSIHVRYDLAVASEAREATERALQLHPEGCPAHQSVKDAIAITWDATVRIGDQTITVREGEGRDATSA